ncbi:MAG: prolyl oligopeptidase family serine peptidase [Phycisphaerales bacterium]
MRSIRSSATLLLALFAGASLALAQPFVYPPAEKSTHVDEYFGTKVSDPYRWLEENDSSKTREWIEAENKVTFAFLASIPEREAIKKRLTALWNYERFSAPGKDGGRYFYSRNDGLQNQSVLFWTKALDAQPTVLIDPNTFAKDGTVALAGTSVSDDGKLIAYGVADAGSDWNTWKVRDIDTGKNLPDEIKWVKFSGASWTKDNKGFFYSRYDEPTGDKLQALNKYPKVFYHGVGTKQADNIPIYERPDQADWGFGVGVTDDGQYAAMIVSHGTDRKNRFFYRDLKANPLAMQPAPGDLAVREAEKAVKEVAVKAAALKADDQSDAAKALRAELATRQAARAAAVKGNGNASFGFVELLNDFDASYDMIGNDGPVFWFATDLKAPRGRVIAIDTRSPARENWKELIPQSDATLTGVSHVGGRLIAQYLKDASSQVKVFGTDGKFVADVKLPGIGTAGGFGGKPSDPETFYSYSSYGTPPSVFSYNVQTGESKLFKQAKVDFNPADYTTTQVFYTSKDGTKVPMFISHKKGLALDGTNATLLYGYGGFNISITPGFSPANLQWMEMGGIYAVANIRGGGEYGEEWHQAGTKLNKQNVFDDFIAAGEYLVAQKYTQPAKLAIQGGSNGGLLVGACMTQRPDLFGACLPAVGVMDMLRFHTFTIGHAWRSDYGSSENADQFKAINAFSPYHVLVRAAEAKAGKKYPSTLVTTADHDDRVVPAHSFKFAAALQAAHTGENPVLIRIETRAGHGAGKPTGKRIEEVADQWAFLVKTLGAKPIIPAGTVGAADMTK